jgi:hypothetical protein
VCPAQQQGADRDHHEDDDDQLGVVRGLVDDHVHAVDGRDRGDRQRDRRDHGEPLHGQGHLGVDAGLVQLDHGEHEVPLAVADRRHPAELVGQVVGEGAVLLPDEPGQGRDPRVDVAGLGRHGARDDQLVPDQEHPLQHRIWLL